MQKLKSWIYSNLILNYSILFYLFACFAYWIVSLFDQSPVGSPIYASAYHWEYPFHFLGVFAIILFLNFIIFKRNFYRFYKKKPNFFYLFFYGIWLFFSIIFSGVLWSYFDMKAGYFPEFGLLFQKLLTDMFYGLTWGIFLIGCAVPFNLAMLIFSFFIIRDFKKNVFDKI